MDGYVAYLLGHLKCINGILLAGLGAEILLLGVCMAVA